VFFQVQRAPRIFCQPNDRATGLRQPASGGKLGRTRGAGHVFPARANLLHFLLWSYGMRLANPETRSWWWYPVFGVLAGFSYLSKPSFEPFLVVFAASLGLRLILDRDLAPVPEVSRSRSARNASGH
jgi:hypothetical protein